MPVSVKRKCRSGAVNGELMMGFSMAGVGIFPISFPLRSGGLYALCWPPATGRLSRQGAAGALLGEGVGGGLRDGSGACAGYARYGCGPHSPPRGDRTLLCRRGALSGRFVGAQGSNRRAGRRVLLPVILGGNRSGAVCGNSRGKENSRVSRRSRGWSHSSRVNPPCRSADLLTGMLGCMAVRFLLQSNRVYRCRRQMDGAGWQGSGRTWIALRQAPLHSDYAGYKDSAQPGNALLLTCLDYPLAQGGAPVGGVYPHGVENCLDVSIASDFVITKIS